MRSDLLSDDQRARTRWDVDHWDLPDEVPHVDRAPGRGDRVRWLVWGVLWFVMLAILAAGSAGWWLVQRITEQEVVGEPLSFTVSEGESVSDIGVRLEAAGVIADAGVFSWYVKEKGGLEPEPGLYRVVPGAHVGDVLGVLRTSPSETYRRVTFPEGFTVDQIAERLESEIDNLSREEFLSLAGDPTRRVPWRPADTSSLEGLLFPDTYQVSNADNEGQIIERMIELMERVAIQEELELRSSALGLSPYEALIVASMVEREAKVDGDRALIARVIYNRLELGMNLEIDATLYYGSSTDTPFALLKSRDFPYNTYRYGGLPPTPIANPGRASIRAALNPAPDPSSGNELCEVLDDPTVGCNYLYYVLADDDGSHAFAVTFGQHQANAESARAKGLLG